MDEPQRRAVAEMWGLGDYRLLADRLRPAAETLSEAVGDGHGRRALDAAAGTGTVALALVQRGWRAEASDISPALIDQGRESTRELAVRWHEAPLDALPFADASFDLVASSFGLIFATDPRSALVESRRCLRPGGRLAMTAWTPEGYMGRMTATMLPFVPSGPPGAPSPLDWGSPGIAAERLEAAGFRVASSEVHSVPWEFDSPEAGARFLFENSPAHVASFTMAEGRAPEMVHAVRDHLAEAAGTENGPVRLAAEYTLTLAEAR